MPFAKQITLAVAAAALGFAVIGAAADDPAATSAPEVATPDKPVAESADAPDPFAIPEGTDADTLQNYLTKLSSTRPKRVTPATLREHFRKMDDVAKEIVSRKVDDKTALMATDLRLALLNQLGRFGDEDAAADRQALIASLVTDERPGLRERGILYGLAQRIAAVDELESADRKKLIDDVADYAQDGELTNERVQLAMLTARNLEMLNDYELAAEANDRFAKVFEARNDDELKDVVESMRGTGRRLGLPGHAMEVQGKTLTGEEFDMKQYNGKVVLVDFWATWCGPCMAELPHVKEMYDAYHDKGFEVVGISLDHDRNELVKILKEQHIPWIQIYPEGAEDDSFSSPIAMHYGVNAIPTAILINQEGKVVTLEARGEQLTLELEKLLGPAEKQPAAEKEEEGLKKDPLEKKVE